MLKLFTRHCIYQTKHAYLHVSRVSDLTHPIKWTYLTIHTDFFTDFQYDTGPASKGD